MSYAHCCPDFTFLIAPFDYISRLLSIRYFDSTDNKHVTFLSCTEGLFYETCNKHTSLPIECTIYYISILAIIIDRFVLCDGQISYDGD